MAVEIKLLVAPEPIVRQVRRAVDIGAVHSHMARAEQAKAVTKGKPAMMGNQELRTAATDQDQQEIRITEKDSSGWERLGRKS